MTVYIDAWPSNLAQNTVHYRPEPWLIWPSSLAQDRPLLRGRPLSLFWTVHFGPDSAVTLSNFSDNFSSSFKLSKFSETLQLQMKLSNFARSFPISLGSFQLRSVLSNCTWLFPTSAKLSNLKLSNFSFFPIALSNYTYPVSFHSQKNPTVRVLRIGYMMHFRIRVPIKIKNIPKSDLKSVTITFISFPKKFSDIQFSEGGQSPLNFRILNFRFNHS